MPPSWKGHFPGDPNAPLGHPGGPGPGGPNSYNTPPGPGTPTLPGGPGTPGGFPGAGPGPAGFPGPSPGGGGGNPPQLVPCGPSSGNQLMGSPAGNSGSSTPGMISSERLTQFVGTLVKLRSQHFKCQQQTVQTLILR